MTQTLLALIQVAMGNRKELPETLSEEQWYRVRKQSEQHRMLGIVFAGVRTLPYGQQPPKKILIEWAMQAELITKANERRDYLCQRAFAQLECNNITSAVLKGQANSINYPIHLRTLRMPGDLDLWIGPDIQTAIWYVYKYTLPVEGIRYNHIDFPILGDVPVELHYRPIFRCQPFYNYRIQRWFNAQWQNAPFSLYNGFRIIDNRLNVIYQLLHMYRHLFEENICLRQVVDYIYVLHNLPSDLTLQQIMQQIKYFGLARFAQGLMYVVRRIDPTVPIFCEEDAKQREFLLNEIFNINRSKSKTVTDLRLFTRYPGEAICEPFFRLWHFIWRLDKRIFIKKRVK